MVSHNTVKGGNDTIRRSVAAITMPWFVVSTTTTAEEKSKSATGLAEQERSPKKNSRALFPFDKLVNFDINDEYLGNFKQNGVEKLNNQKRGGRG